MVLIVVFVVSELTVFCIDSHLDIFNIWTFGHLDIWTFGHLDILFHFAICHFAVFAVRRSFVVL